MSNDSLHVHVPKYDETQDYIETMDTAEKACETSKLIRLARTSGRREADREVQGLNDRLVLAIHLLDKLMGITRKGEFTENEIANIEHGIRFVKDPESAFCVGSCVSGCAESGGNDLCAEILPGPPNGDG